MSNDHVRLHVEASVVVFFGGGGNSVQKMCTTAPYRITMNSEHNYSSNIFRLFRSMSSILECYFKNISEKYIKSRLSYF